MTTDSSLIVVRGSGLVRKLSMMYESRTNYDAKPMNKMRVHKPTVNAHNRRQTSNVTMLSLLFDNPLFQAYFNMDQNSEKLSPAQIRKMFVSILAPGTKLPPSEIGKTGETKSVAPGLALNFSFLKKFVIHALSNPAGLLINQPALQITDFPKKAKVKTALTKQKLNQEGVPIVVVKCIDFIFRYGLRSEGIYRVNGNTDKVKKLLLRFKKSPEKFIIKYPKYDEYDVASAFKKYIRELPKSLFCDLTDDFLKTFQLSDATRKKLVYRDLLESLPLAEYKTLRKIVDHLREITAFASDNKMPAGNLAIVWAQTLLIGDVTNYTLCNNLLEDLMHCFDDVFGSTRPSDQTVDRKKFIASSKQKDATKVWIKFVIEKDAAAANDDGHYMKTTLATDKTVYYACKELVEQYQMSAANVTMVEVLFDGTLKRPMHPNEVMTESVERWVEFSTAERQNNHFMVTPTKFFYHTEVVSKLKTTFVVNYMNNIEVRTLVPYTVIIEDEQFLILVNNNEGTMKRQRLEIRMLYAYLGAYESICGTVAKNAITLFEFDEIDRKPEDPLKCHVLTSNSDEAQMILYMSITHNSHAGMEYKYRNSMQPVWSVVEST